jgi:protein ImuA
MAKPLDALIDASPCLWRGGRATQAMDVLATGFSALDRALPGKGWPRGSVIELLLPAVGIGELRLLLPAMVKVTHSRRHVVLIDPPYQPYAPAFSNAGVDLEYVLVVSPERRLDALWSAEKALANQACGMVLLWHGDERKKAAQRDEPQAVRRLQVAAQAGRTLLFLYRPIASRTRGAVQQHSWAAVRLLLSAAGNHLGVEILKARGSYERACINLSLELELSRLPEAAPTS